MGGLGNQLFQYAAGKALSVKHNVPLKIDTTFFTSKLKESVTKRDFELNLFQVNANIASQEEVDVFAKQSLFQKIANRFLSPSFSKYYYAEEKRQSSVSDFSKYYNNTYLDGYWQSELYFKNIRQELLKEFVIKKDIPENCNVAIQKITNSNSVSIHIRRGDYVSNSSASTIYHSLELDYYYNALDLISSRKGGVSIFVFSDDVKWVKENFKPLQDYMLIDFNTGENSVFDMYLMSLCKHNIIANSSFSWWGAWLNQNQDKMVIAPKKWYKTSEHNSINLIPDSWIKL